MTLLGRRIRGTAKKRSTVVPYPSIRGFSVDNSDSEALATVYSEGEVPQLVIHKTKFQWLWIRYGEVSVVVDSKDKVREL